VATKVREKGQGNIEVATKLDDKVRLLPEDTHSWPQRVNDKVRPWVRLWAEDTHSWPQRCMIR
jgi:hypothetical protein